MPVHVSIDKENDLVVRTVRGLVSMIEIFYDMDKAKKWLGIQVDP